MSKLDLIAPDSAEAAFSRRSLVQSIAGTALAMTFLAGCGGSDDDNDNGGLNGNSNTDTAILQFALNLEYLEAEFYSFATTGQGIEGEVLLTGVGTLGPTTGGAQTTFTSQYGAAIAAEVAADELNHVRVLRGALEAQAIAKPAININPLGLNLATEAGFLTLARAFEDVGVSAYLGAAPAISSSAYVATAAAILAVEGLHTGNIRLQLVQQGAPAGSALDSKDQPPSATNFFAVDAAALAVPRNPSQVLAIVYANAGLTPGGFFPAGANLSAGNAERLLALR